MQPMQSGLFTNWQIDKLQTDNLANLQTVQISKLKNWQKTVGYENCVENEVGVGFGVGVEIGVSFEGYHLLVRLGLGLRIG